MNCMLCGASRATRMFSLENSGIIKCRGCGFMFRDPYRGCIAGKCAACPDRCIDRILDPLFLEARQRVDDRRAERIQALAGNDLSTFKILELGTGLGCLASRLSETAGDYLGTEPSSIFQAIQLDNFKGLSGKVINTILPGAEYEDYFDLLIAVDVMQFAENPLQFIKAAERYLVQGGLIYLEVPDESLLRLRAVLRRSLGLYRGEPVHHGHINFFTPGSLRLMLERSGLKIEMTAPLSIAGDEDRLFLTVKKPLPAYLKTLSYLARTTKADLLLGLGNTVCLCSKRGR